MLNIEEFSIDAWCTPGAVKFNRRTSRGILYRGCSRVANAEYFRADEIKRKEVVVRERDSRRGFTWGT